MVPLGTVPGSDCARHNLERRWAMKRTWLAGVVVMSAVALMAAAGCKKKSAGAGGAAGTSGGLAAYLKRPQHTQLAARAKEVRELAAKKKCDAAVAKAKEAIRLLKRLVPGLGAVAEQGVKDKAVGAYLGDLYAIRATLEMSVSSYEKEKPGSLDMRPHYCKAVASDLAKVKQGT